MTLTMKFLDIGLGTSILIETDKINIIFDCGIDSETGNNAFKELDDDKLDYLILTHPHKDHIESLISPDYKNPSQITKNNSIKKSLIEKQINNAKTNYDCSIFTKYKEINEEYTHPVSESESFSNPINNGNIILKNFIPSKQNGEELNDYSIATYVSYKEHSILLMGDNTPKNIEELMEDTDFKSEIENIDVLLAPHHGRKSGYVPEFVQYLNPTITIISDKSEDNNESAQDRYEYYSNGMYITKNGKKDFRQTLTTRNEGDITLTITNTGDLSIECNK